MHHCYALTLARRLKAMGQAATRTTNAAPTSGPGFAVTVHEDTVGAPLRWHLPRLAFVNSMSDLGHARVSAAFVARVFAVMALTLEQTYQVLTKRPRCLAALLSSEEFTGGTGPAGHRGVRCGAARAGPRARRAAAGVWPLPNVWLGASVERDTCTWRADTLRQAPTAVRFLSCEPLLGPLPSLDLAGIG